MTNPYYQATGTPSTGAFAASAPMRSEFNDLEEAFDLLPALTANTAVVVNSAGTALTNTVGTLALAGNFALTGAYAVTLVAGAAVSLTLPVVSGLTLATLTGTETLTNKTMVAPSLGTPTVLVGTNITGTAAGLTAGNVTTNANLTGPIASSGNTTSITAQTGTGTTFVVQTSPTLVTPVLGVATATSINGIGIAGTNGKTVTISNSITLAGTDATVMTFPATSATIARTDAANTFTGIQTFSTPIASASMAAMTATVGGRVPTPPNNTTDFLRGDGTFAMPTASVDYQLIESRTISGTPSTISFTDLTSEDILIVFFGVSITASTANLQMAVSVNNGVGYGTTRQISVTSDLSTSLKYGGCFLTGLRIGFVNLYWSGLGTTTFSINSVTSPTPVTAGFFPNDNVDAIQLSASASTFVDGGVVKIYGRG